MHLKPVTHVIFDMDGLIIESESFYKKILNDIAQQYGKEYTPDIEKKILGTTETDTAKIFLSELKVPLSIEEFLKLYHQKVAIELQNPPLMPGAERLIAHLSKHNIPIAVATSSSKESLEVKTKNHQNVFKLFHHIVCGTTDPEVKNGKPAPDIFLVAASRFDDKPDSSKGDADSKKIAGGAVAGEQKHETEEILNTILPPKEWEEDGQLWRQEVSTTPATRLDVVNLQEQLDMRLQQRQARETGICPVRRELYTQCFDEIIRQVTINCAERGLLLLRVRDEMRMTIEAYQALYCSSIAFGMRKALQAEQGKSDLNQEVDLLKNEKTELEHQITELKQRAEQADRRAAETRLAEERKHTEEIAFLKKTNQQLKAQLEGIIAPKK